MTLYFAYGSNMSRTLMAARCPAARALGPVRLCGYRFIISGDRYASVAPAPGACVHGVLWRLTARDLAALNAYESLDSGLYRRVLLPVRHASGPVRALVYVGRSRQRGIPKPGYHDGIVLPAARDWALPKTYLEELARWSPASGARSRAGRTSGERR
jgi:gamma-glutamylcyclotransferase (GGCT)/AIG2-like uncharacterized protein YtfP